MKRGISLPLCLSVVLLAAACGGQGTPSAPSGEGAAPSSGVAEIPVGDGSGGSTVSATVPVGSGVSSVTGITLMRLPVPVMESVVPVVEEVAGGGVHFGERRSGLLVRVARGSFGGVLGVED